MTTEKIKSLTQTPTPTPSVQDRAREVAHDLIGTCRSLEDFATEDERDSQIFCAELDALCFCCTVCEWWAGEEYEVYQGICEECAEEGHTE